MFRNVVVLLVVVGLIVSLSPHHSLADDPSPFKIFLPTVSNNPVAEGPSLSTPWFPRPGQAMWLGNPNAGSLASGSVTQSLSALGLPTDKIDEIGAEGWIDAHEVNMDFEGSHGWVWQNANYDSGRNAPGGSGGAAMLNPGGYVAAYLTGKPDWADFARGSSWVYAPHGGKIQLYLAQTINGKTRYCHPDDGINVSLSAKSGWQDPDSINLEIDCDVDIRYEMVFVAFNSGDEIIWVDATRFEPWEVTIGSYGSGHRDGNKWCFDNRQYGCLSLDYIYDFGTPPAPGKNYLTWIPNSLPVANSLSGKCPGVCAPLNQAEAALALVVVAPPVGLVVVGSILIVTVVIIAASGNEMTFQAEYHEPWNVDTASRVFPLLYQNYDGRDYPIDPPIKLTRADDGVDGFVYSSQVIAMMATTYYDSVYTNQLITTNVPTLAGDAVWTANSTSGDPQTDYLPHLGKHPEAATVWGRFNTSTSGGYQRPPNPDFKSLCSAAWHALGAVFGANNPYPHTRHAWIMPDGDEADILIWGERGRFLNGKWVSSGKDWLITAFRAESYIDGNGIKRTWRDAVERMIKREMFHPCDILGGPPLPPWPTGA